MSWKSTLGIPLLSRVAPFVLRQQRRRGCLTILAYHRIMERTEDFAFDEGVISASPEDFERQVRFFKDYFSLITFRDLKKCLEDGRDFPFPPLIITFDDGYKDNYMHAFPILKKHEVPATVFLSVNHIETGQPYWWDEVAFYMKAANKSGVEIEDFLQSLKVIPNNERIERIAALSQSAGADPSHMERQSLTWEEIMEMHKGGIEFGSHTMTHPVLSRVNNQDDLEFEIRQSKKVIEERLGSEVVVFSYPVGGQHGFNNSIREKVKEAGYDFTATYIHGVNYFKEGTIDRHNLKRVALDRNDLDRIKVKIAFPALF